jgi:hypothetical protein
VTGSNIFIEALALVPDSVRVRITTHQQMQFERFFLDYMKSLMMASADEFFTQLVEQINEGLSAPFLAGVVAPSPISLRSPIICPLPRPQRLFGNTRVDKRGILRL